MTASLQIHRRWHGFFSILNGSDILFTKSVSSYSALTTVFKCSLYCCGVEAAAVVGAAVWFGPALASPLCPRAGGGECRRHQPRLSGRH